MVLRAGCWTIDLDAKPMRYPLSRALRHQSRSSGTPFSNPPTASKTERHTNIDAVTVKLRFLTYRSFWKAKTLSNASAAVIRRGSSTRTSTRPPAKSADCNSARPSSSQRRSGRQSLSMNAIASPRDARTPAFRAGPAPRSATSTTRPRVPTMWRTTSSPRELPLSATMTSLRSSGKLCSPSSVKQASKLS